MISKKINKYFIFTNKKKFNSISNLKNHKKILLFYTLALVIIFLSIPWPFREALGVANWA